MAYNPQVKVFDNRKTIDGLLELFKARQAEALAWANDGAALPPIKDFHKSARTVKQYPALSVIQSSHAAKFKSDILVIDFAATFEVAIQDGRQDYLAEVSPKYSMALESMLINVPNSTFNESSKIYIDVTIDALETAFAVQGKQKTKFLQLFQTSASWTIEAALRD